MARDGGRGPARRRDPPEVRLRAHDARGHDVLPGSLPASGGRAPHISIGISLGPSLTVLSSCVSTARDHSR